VEEVAESNILEEVESQLQRLLTGISPVDAFDALNAWLYICAEQRRKITQSDIITKITNIGKFLHERYAFHQEWFTTIKLLEDELSIQRGELAEEFYEGISARYEHILAGVDAIRIQKLEAIYSAFQKSRVVIVHGASGQGKSTLAYRYIYEVYPKTWRFQVRGISSSKHSYTIANALLGHINAVGVPAIVYVDVLPGDNHWTDLIQELASYDLVHVLVTIREEDFRRASISNDQFRFETTELLFNKEEAQNIYAGLQLVQNVTDFLNFEDAWNKFGESGPLLEFVYLVTQGQSLKAKLESQINKLRDEVRLQEIMPAELLLLRLVSVATAYESRLKISSLIADLDLPDHERTFQLLEKEYLLWRDNELGLIYGIHPIRSQIIVNLLSTDWIDDASQCLNHIYEPDLENFLLYSFLLHEREVQDELQNTLSQLEFNSWIGALGCLKALLWLGVKHYSEENAELLSNSFQQFGSWMHVLDIDVSDAMPGVADNALVTFKKLFSPELMNQIEIYRKQQTDKQAVYIPANTWLRSAKFDLTAPNNLDEWNAFATCSLYFGHFPLKSDFIHHFIDLIELEEFFDLPIETLSNWVWGAYQIDSDIVDKFLDTHVEALAEKYKQEQDVLHVESNEHEIKIHFWVQDDDEDDLQDSKNDSLGRQAVTRLRVLRKLFPNREVYASQGYGHDIFPIEMPFDATKKQIAQHNFALEQATGLNATFRGVSELPLRPDIWQEFIDRVIQQRSEVVSQLKNLERVLGRYFGKKGMYQVYDAIKKTEWDKFSAEIGKPILLPKSAVDKWGFADELLPNNKDVVNFQRQSLALQHVKPFQKAYRNYQSDLSNFFSQATHVMVAAPIIGRGNLDEEDFWWEAEKQKIERRFMRLSVINLHNVLKCLPVVQETFRERFLGLMNEPQITELEKLEKKEIKVLQNIADLWLPFAIRPQAHYQNPAKDSRDWHQRRLKEIKKHLRKSWRDIKTNNTNIRIISEDVLWNGDSAIWIAIDSSDLLEANDLIEVIIGSIQKAVVTVGDKGTTELILNRFWEHFLIMVLKDGKKALHQVCHLDWDDCYKKPEEIRFWSLMTQELPLLLLQELGIKVLDNDYAKLGQALFTQVSTLNLLVARFDEIKKLPLLDDDVAIRGQEIIDETIAAISAPLHSVMNTIGAMMQFISSIDSNEIESHQFTLEAASGLKQLSSLVLLDEHVKDNVLVLSLEESIKWRSQLGDAQKLAFKISLLWLSDTFVEGD